MNNRISYKWKAFCAVAFSSIINVINMSSIFMLLSVIAKDFSLTLKEASWAFLAQSLTVTALVLPMGRFSDIIGRKKGLILSMLFFSTGSIICYLSQFFSIFIFGRIIMGIGISMLMGVGNAIIFSVLGAVIGYLIGYIFFNEIGIKIFELFGAENAIIFKEKLASEKGLLSGILILFIAGFTPLPFKIITISSGFVHFNIFFFIITCFLARGLRFLLVGYLTYKYGSAIGPFLEKKGGQWTVAISAIIVVIAIGIYFISD